MGWLDSVGGVSADFVAGAKRPEYQATGWDGTLPCIAAGAQCADGISTLQMDSDISAGNTDLSIYLVIDKTNSIASQYLFDSEAGRTLIATGDSSEFMSYRSDAGWETSTNTLAVLGKQCVTLIAEAGAGALYVNRVLVESGGWTQQPIAGATNFFSHNNSSSSYWDGLCAAIFVYGEAHNAGQSTAVHDYINSVWGVAA